MTAAIRRLGVGDGEAAPALNQLFAEAFGDEASYASSPPSQAYLDRLLSREGVIILIAEAGGTLVGGLVAYVLEKLEQERSEIYIYDLAVAESHRRQGVATTLIAELQVIATQTGAWVVYVQADYGDDPAIALYTGLGEREDVMHFDIPPQTTR